MMCEGGFIASLHWQGDKMKTITAKKFISLCNTCRLLGTMEPLQPYKGYRVVAENFHEFQEVKSHCKLISFYEMRQRIS